MARFFDKTYDKEYAENIRKAKEGPWVAGNGSYGGPRASDKIMGNKPSPCNTHNFTGHAGFSEKSKTIAVILFGLLAVFLIAIVFTHR